MDSGQDRLLQFDRDLLSGKNTAAWAFGKKILYKLTLPIGAQEVGITATVTGWDAEDPVTPTVD